MKAKHFFLATLLVSAVLLFLALTTHAQQIPDWQNKDLQTDSLFGISTNKAYSLLQGKKSKRVIVAVIDAGVDTLHEDLQSILWINPKKQKGDNGTYGWSYLGSAKGNVQFDNLELTRQIRQFNGDTSSNVYQSLKRNWTKQFNEANNSLKGMTGFAQVLDGIVAKIGKTNPTKADFEHFTATNVSETQVRKTMLSVLSQTDYQTFRHNQIENGIEHYKIAVNYQLNTAYDPRPQFVGDDYQNSKQHDYGSPDNNGPDPTHGTHVAGIIAGIRHNGIGLDGIADNVKVLAIRAVPDGDERDKDIANAIRYATDHGAKIINMSFGKPYASDKKAVDEAVQYALKKDVLLIQAAGNSNENIDSVANFPSRRYLNGQIADAYIVVGASGLKNDNTLKASFSNYGKQAVDVFAPGVQIYSSVPGSKYDYFDGTSMAAPVVAGLAALIREYYPKLKAKQVKEIILKSVVKANALLPYCQTGGVVNAYNAIQIAATY